MIAILTTLAITFILMMLMFWGFFAIGVRNSVASSPADFMLAGIISMVPMFLAICCIVLIIKIY
ncbi:MAG: hypothetical protein KDE53_07695 [Caldilineaceae bacterium]|nr:hypothetical protein [Caldilineaceae bacterium]